MAYWSRFEQSPSFGGPRGALRKTLGANVLALLERMGVLKTCGVAYRYPCHERAGDGCPRHIVKTKSDWLAVCGNAPAQCADLALAEDDVAQLAFDPLALCRALAVPFLIHPRPAKLDGLAGIWQLGNFIPEPGVKHAVFLILRSGAHAMAEAIETIRSRQDGQACIVFIPTGAVLSHEIESRARTCSITLVVLAETVGLGENGFNVLTDPLRLLMPRQVGSAAAASLAEPVIGRALIGHGDGMKFWKDLNDAEHSALVAQAAEFEIFADELTRHAWKTQDGRRREKGNIPTSSFDLLRAAAERRGIYDPATDATFERDYTDPRQLFTKGRQVIDIKEKGKDWALFKTRMVDSSAHYIFDPDPGIRYALIFRARG